MMPTFSDPVLELPAAAPTPILRLAAAAARVCQTCGGAGAIQHGSRNPELVTDCPACDGTGERGAA